MTWVPAALCPLMHRTLFCVAEFGLRSHSSHTKGSSTLAKYVSRRSIIAGLGAGCAPLLLFRRLAPAQALVSLTGEPGGLDLCLTALSPNILRIAVAPLNAWQPGEELGIVEQPAATVLIRKPHPVADLPWGDYRITVEQDPLRVTVARPERNFRQQIEFDNDSAAVRFGISDAPLFGLGEGVPRYDLRGAKYGLDNGEGTPNLRLDGARVPIPWLISAGGWGLFIGQPSGQFDLTGPTGVFRPIEAFASRNVYLVLADTPAEILRGYAQLTGFPHLPPLWSLGYQQSHRTLARPGDVLDEARMFREKNLPCDTMIYLGTGFCPSGWNTGHGSFTFNADVFPDPKAMIERLHELHFKVVLHMVPPGDFHGTVHDTGSEATEPGDAVAYWRQHLPVEQAGVDGWWPDEGDKLAVTARLERNQFYWDGPLSAHPDRRPFALHRNGYAGLQRFGWLWSGDIDSSWATLAAQVRDGINVGLCGIPYWGTDTGGFFPTHELTPELYIRWFQFSAFCPLFRSHGRAWKLRLPWGWNSGTPGPLEGSESLGPNWPPAADLHNAQVEEICRQYLNLRYTLLPYIYSSVAQTHRTGLPLMRPLWIAYPGDTQALQRDDEYLFGDLFLVAPVLSASAQHRVVYLPAGQWRDFWTGDPVAGGQELSRIVDLKTMPLYIRAGAVLPIGPVRQYVSEAFDAILKVRVYPGADGGFSYYEDDGESFRYRQGDFTGVDFAWSDRTRTLMLRTDPHGKPAIGRKFSIEMVGGGLPVAVTLQGRTAEVRL
jgi:alpha-glucosidase (family GH31 glycosyl hydrolase)